MMHIVDTERVFGYRATHIARRDPAPLPGFDQDQWMQSLDSSTTTLAAVLEEWVAVRVSLLHLFSRLSATDWQAHGIASDHTMTPRACAYIIVGHWEHHARLLGLR
jgi:DinB superfamily